MAEQGVRGAFVIKHNRYARPQACGTCNTDRNLSIGPGLFQEGTWQGICEECAARLAPGLLAMLSSPKAQRAYWEAEQAAGEQQRQEVGETLASLEAELEGLQARLEDTQQRLEALRGSGG
ncbi:MAG: hypothetical protein FJX74_26280 [Armatimonadetes bacterium]|nr:hypothetical protein [Armatimonadota bacterium]